MTENLYTRHYPLMTAPSYDREEASERIPLRTLPMDDWGPSGTLLASIGNAWLVEKPWKGPWERSLDKLLEE